MAIKHANGTGGPGSVAERLKKKGVAVVASEGNEEACGADIGNTNSKFWFLDAGRNTLADNILPSALAPGNPERMKLLEKGLGNTTETAVSWIKRQDSFGTDSISLGGLSALTQSRLASSQRGRADRYWDDEALTRLLLGIALTRPHRQNLSLQVVTGVPIRVAFAYPDYQKRVRSALAGTHSFEVNGKPYTVNLAVPLVLMEGCAALVGYDTENDGVYRAVIDIGGQTTDVVVTQGVRPVESRSGGIDVGIETIADFASEAIEQKYGRALRIDERYLLLYAFMQHCNAVKDADIAKVQWPKISVPGRQIDNGDLLRLCQRGAQEVSSQVLSYLGTRWGLAGGRDLEKIYLIGGNPRAFAPRLAERFSNLTYSTEDAPLANAKGYAHLAAFALRS